MGDLFVVGDIYGYKEKFDQLIKQWNPNREKLIFVGNFIGNGPNSLGVIKEVFNLSNKHGAVILGGAQEDLFLKWLSNPNIHPIIYYNKGGREIISSFLDKEATSKFTPESIAQNIIFDFYQEINFLHNLPDHFEESTHIIVPAGLRLNMKNWKMTTSEHFKWGHESFQYGENKTGKTILFGHIPTKQLHRKETFDIWISPCKSKIGLNGSANLGGVCHAVRISQGAYKFLTA
ncbi:serine/threonine protein phosphatase (plasmid) [Paenibacillus thiaminolyticus]|uniref:serine/threonine protein phosphatase n=1 Tax=Paenibacillus thiaminolyticus TaxID=49283 RepID=UPI00232C6D87|nr:serine/threonine protein phosphatase [Paenibacillus thiaminolyticus]WCF11635.1 serine/threonine protein phosphatase [Paenibacillus thiaminolyticus]